MYAHRMHNLCTKSAQAPAAPQGHLRHDPGSRRSKREGRAQSGQVDPGLTIVTPEVVAAVLRFLDRARHRRCFGLSGMALAAAGSFGSDRPDAIGEFHRRDRNRARPSRPASETDEVEVTSETIEAGLEEIWRHDITEPVAGELRAAVAAIYRAMREARL
jgi:hypothetical protein